MNDLFRVKLYRDELGNVDSRSSEYLLTLFPHVVHSSRPLNTFNYTTDQIFSQKQTIRTQIRLNPKEQSDVGPYCLQYRPPGNISRHEKKTTKVITGWLRVKIDVI